ncbi:hypothetical protein GUITHDRAFT_148645 [Guillardia theta CCMP2712]|uniref:Uncharacterized protein n=1 Tax=Guillardia theta (strain CCMP2712) TaxID=905079 RepID=L1I857_GUITC|nr:hypothetical protein GUITHDRAFT_148645 [Guillardia theta CCMP2712]EKX32403.1 hypothetical protein GUITHDRAFT_148645 [Guillardia theta CCMP2712]|eukprot:XP_005819383.1 hypothetical protein GUITHDRAFT_148645 [Guillardia theta CCMP2712]
MVRGLRGCGLSSSSHASEVYAMSPIQEAMNGISMVVPTVVLGLDAWTTGDWHVTVLLLGSCMHLPVSFTYHLSVACGRYRDRLDNDMRRLDQSMQHVVGTLYCFALSGSLWYMIANAVFNGVSVVKLWDARTSNDGRRWVRVMVSMLLYTGPVIWRGDYWNYGVVVASMALCGVCFVPRVNCGVFSGWGHTMFHVILGFYASALARSALKVGGIGST